MTILGTSWTTPLSPEFRTFLLRAGVVAREPGDVELLGRFFAGLQETNSTTNLTRILTERDFWVKHVADSLALGAVLPGLMVEPWRVADVGCGGGFPMVPLAWANPRLRITGIEARNRKAEFVAGMCEQLGLQNCSVLPVQAREAGRTADHAGSYELVVMRAVGPPERMLRPCRQLLLRDASAAIAFYMTPRAIAEERGTALREAEKYGFSLRVSEMIDLPYGAGARQFLIAVNGAGLEAERERWHQHTTVMEE